MSYVAHETQHRDGDFDWPLFLSRDDTDGGSNQPPPLPHGPVIARAIRIWSETPKLRLCAVATVFAGGAAAVAATAGWTREDGLMPTRIEIVRTKTANVLPSIDQAEQRLNFSGRLPVQLQNTAAGPEAATERNKDPADDAVDDAVIETATADAADPVALLILRNLPENTGFATGAPAGKGEWVMAAGDGDIDQLAQILGVEFEQPVMADVEMVSRSGLSLGTLQLQLQKDTEEKVSEVVSTPQASAFVTDEEKPEAKPAKPAAQRKLAQVSKAQRAARAEARAKRHAKRIMDAWKVKKLEPSNEEVPDTGTATAQADSAAEEKGTITKLFTWLKGDTTKTPQVEVDPPPSGLGMFPPK